MKRRVKALTVVLAICLITVFIRCQSNETPIQQLVVVVNGDSIEMVFVKGGTFMMGCTDEQGCDCEDNEKPARKESVSDFFFFFCYLHLVYIFQVLKVHLLKLLLIMLQLYLMLLE